MDKRKNDEIRRAVQENYGRIAAAGQSGCGCSSSCCGTPDSLQPKGQRAAEIALGLGYSGEEVAAVPEGANLGLGCGNPQAIASLAPGETVLDLGSGAGFDCFLAARAVGDKGQVIGVDMTPEMIDKARRNAEKTGLTNVDFRLGELEHLPVADGTIDVIISNCVINLSPEKEQVFREAFRVLKPGGRLAVADVVALADLPETLKNDMALHTGCIAGASRVQELESLLRKAGFANIQIRPKAGSADFIREWLPGRAIEEYVASAVLEAVKPLN